MSQTALKSPSRSSPKELQYFLAHLESGKSPDNLYTALLGYESIDFETLLLKIEKGFPYSAFERFSSITALSQKMLSTIMRTKYRTLSRRKEAGKLNPEESDRLLTAVRIFAHAIALFEGNVDSARNWLRAPVIALGGKTPLEYLETDLGTREVENLITRLEYGIPS